MGNRDLLLGNLEARLRPEDQQFERDGRQLAFKRHTVHLTVDQEELLRAAVAKRGIPSVRGPGLGYITLATLAFIAYDMDVNFLELMSGKKIPDDPILAQAVADASRKQRGQWGIVDLSDHQRGRR